MDILEKLDDLHKQATQERSHFYVAATTKAASEEIIRLRTLLLEGSHKIRERSIYSGWTELADELELGASKESK